MQRGIWSFPTEPLHFSPECRFAFGLQEFGDPSVAGMRGGLGDEDDRFEGFYLAEEQPAIPAVVLPMGQQYPSRRGGVFVTTVAPIARTGADVVNVVILFNGGFFGQVVEDRGGAFAEFLRPGDGNEVATRAPAGFDASREAVGVECVMPGRNRKGRVQNGVFDGERGQCQSPSREAVCRVVILREAEATG